jgi:hypothetical protein
MEYEEEDDGLFGSDVEDVNPAAPIASTSRSLSSPTRPAHATPPTSVRTVPASTSRLPLNLSGPSRLGVSAGTERRYAQDEINSRLEVLREKKGEGLVREYHFRGVSTLKSCCMNGELLGLW